MNNNKFFTLETESRRQFFQVPKQFMIKDSKYYAMTSDAKLLYGILADRNSLSIENKWVDEESRIYFIATVEALIDLTGWAKQKVIEKLKELRKFDLLISKKKGQGNPSWHYLLQIDVEEGLESQVYQQKYENHTSRSVKIKLQEVPNSYPNNTNINNTDINNISSSSEAEASVDDEQIKAILKHCQKCDYKLPRKAIELLVLSYDYMKIIQAITSITLAGVDVKNPAGYLATVLNDMSKNKVINFESKNKEEVNAKAFNNFEAREYDYDNLEKKLLGWE